MVSEGSTSRVSVFFEGETGRIVTKICMVVVGNRGDSQVLSTRGGRGTAFVSLCVGAQLTTSDLERVNEAGWY